MFSKCCTIIAYVLSNYCQYIAQDLASLTIEAIYSIFIGILRGDFGGDPGVTASHPTRHTAESMMTMGARALSRYR